MSIFCKRLEAIKFSLALYFKNNQGENGITEKGCEYLAKIKCENLKKLNLGIHELLKSKTILERKDVPI